VLIVALILGVPVAPALAALVFIGAFVPIVGALVSGFVAVLVALVALGWVQALIMLGGVILVMQIEGHVLQPFLLGRAVKLHPLAVLIAIAIGIIVGGIVGALMAVPLLAFTKSFVLYLAGAAEPPLGRIHPPALPLRRALIGRQGRS
jgi:predicted PurR-regulated permease PerM